LLTVSGAFSRRRDAETADIEPAPKKEERTIDDKRQPATMSAPLYRPTTANDANAAPPDVRYQRRQPCGVAIAKRAMLRAALQAFC
jgi:hypothetical protein